MDWFTSGRIVRGEHWDFNVYSSLSVITTSPLSLDSNTQVKLRRKKNIVVRDALLLDIKNLLLFRDQLAGFNVIGYLLILGPGVESVANVFRGLQNTEKIRPFNPTTNDSKSLSSSIITKEEEGDSVKNYDYSKIKWSVSEINEYGVVGIAVRIAGPSTDLLKRWLKDHLASLRPIIGDSAFDIFYYS